MEGVLQDVKVLDFGRFIACPYCGMLRADMGAEVIRIERPGGEEDRTTGLLASNGQNLSYPSYARNKKGITLRLMKSEKGREILADLVRKSDVVVHNFAPDAAKLMGLTYDELKAIKPDIILTAISCFGSEGPYAKRPGFDFIAQAMSGSLALGGYPDKPPIRAFMNPMDFSTALSAMIGTLLALRHRDQTGEGQMVDLALLRTAISFNASAIAEADVLGKLRPMVGNRAAYVGPTDLFECKDGWVFIATIMDTLWRRLARAIGHEELIEDPDLKTDLQRFENRHKVDHLVAGWCAQRTVDEVVVAMEEARIPCGKHLGLDEISKDPHVQATDMIEYTDLEEPGLEKVPVSGIPMRLSKTPGSVRTRAPRVGEHNLEIYRDVLGYDEEKIAGLTAEGVI
jgi:crotonobetainyl-CoA:carnitine CoA-transferase CaiB-like acyl-CoA transferase